MTSETVWNRTNLHLAVLSLIKQEVFDLQECTSENNFRIGMWPR